MHGARIFFPLRMALLAGAVALLLGPTACDSCSSEDAEGQAAASASAAALPEPSIAISTRLSATQQKAAKRLQRRLNKGKKGRFGKRTVKKKGNAKLFLYLAAASKNPKVIAASLHAMAGSYADRGAKRGRPRANDDYGMVVAAHLQSDQPRVQAAALNAARRAVTGRKPYGPVVDELVAIIESHPNVGARIAGLEAVGKMRGFGKHQAVAGAVLRCLEHKHAAVLAAALLAARRGVGHGLAQQADIAKQTEPLLKHADPVVRARAVHLLLELEPDDEQADQLLATLLRDEHPFARSAAVRLYGKAGEVRGIHAVVPLADDMAVDHHVIKYQGLDRRRASSKHGKAKRTVHDTVVSAVAKLSKQTKTPFVAEPTKGKKDRAAARKANAAAVKAWYAKHKAQLTRKKPPAPAKPEAKPKPKPKP